MNKKKYILVTGAGGSIGTELSIQLVNLREKNIIFVDHTEENIFYLKTKIKSILKKKITKTDYKYLLISITDKFILDKIFKQYTFSDVFHTAAYKHVNLLETNILEAFYNNTIGTKILLDSLKNKCDRFTYVSTDKAVQPVNIMGYTKRASEIIVLNGDYTFNTNIVRFGNVLNSSGSVIPIFKKQINYRKNVTLTSKNATRYFMSIKDAVNLLINCSKLKYNKKIFVLDMGKQIKIIDLAKDMIKIAGLRPVLKHPKDGEIKIEMIGLRKGEKMKEKLTYNNLIKTNFKKIMIANEKINYIKNYNEILLLIDNFYKTYTKNFVNKLKKIINETT